jgi:hypothetical protein
MSIYYYLLNTCTCNLPRAIELTLYLLCTATIRPSSIKASFSRSSYFVSYWTWQFIPPYLQCDYFLYQDADMLGYTLIYVVLTILWCLSMSMIILIYLAGISWIIQSLIHLISPLSAPFLHTHDASNSTD